MKPNFRLVLIGIFLLLESCTTAKPKSDPNLSENIETLTVAQEQYMTREALLELRRDYPALRNSELQNYVNRIGQRIVAANDLAGKPYEYTFTIVQAPMANAYALPAGSIFITTPLLQLVQSESELAGILGHEIGHVLSRHAAIRIINQRNEQKNSWWYGGGGAVLGGLAGAGASSLLCNHSSCSGELIALGAVAGVHGGLLVQKYIFLKQSRDNEKQADQIGFRLALNAGYSANQIGSFYLRLQDKSETKSTKFDLFSDALNTHPASNERMDEIQNMIKNTNQNTSSNINSTEFDKIKKLL